MDGDGFVEALVQGEPPGWVFAATVDRSGNYWVGSDKGLFLPRAVRERGDDSCDRSRFHRAIERSVAASVRSLLEDREGNMWVGTDGDGLLRVRAAPFEPIRPPADVSGSSRVRSLADDGGAGLWIHFPGDKIGRLKDEEWDVLPADDDIRSIIEIASSSDGTLWIKHHHGTRVSKYRDGRFTHIEQEFDSIDSVLVDRRGTVWISSAGGLSTVRDGRIETITVAEGLPTIGVRGVLADSSDGTIWIGADGALTHYRNGEFGQYTSADGLPRGRIRSIHEGSNGNLWIATYGGGMARLRDGKFTRYTTLEGLPDNSLGKILEDDTGNLWINSNRGVFRVSLDELNRFADGRLSRINCRTFQTGEASGRSGARTADGRLWFPTIDGLITIEPDIVAANQVPPPVVIEAAHIADQTFDHMDRIELPMDGRDVAIEYTGLSFVDPGDVTFRSRLIGYNENWLDAGTRRVAHYTNLPPGSYEFQVQARNNDRIWSEHAATLDITVPPHFYETAWFFALCGLGVITTGFVGYRVRTHNMRVRNAVLRQSEERYRRVVEDQSEFIVRWLPDGTRTFVNGAYCRHFGLTQDEAIGTSFFPLIAEEDRARIRRKIDSLTPENPAATAEHRVIRPDGAIGWQQWTDGAIFDSDGEMIELQSVGRDVTERKRAEQALRESEERMELALPGADLGTWDWNVRTGVVAFNERWAEMLGYELDEIEPHLSAWEKLVYSADLPGVQEVQNAHLEDKTDSYETEHRLMHKSGDWVWVLAKGRVIERDADGKPLRVCGTHLDITERKRADEALKEMNVALANAMPGIARLDIDGRYVEVNDIYARMMGFRPDEMIGRDWTPTVHPEDHAGAIHAYERMLLEGNAEFEARGIRKDATAFFKHVLMVRITDEQGASTGHHCFMRDITERKRAEKERRELEDQLRQSQKMEALGGLAAGMAHEINNPLAGILHNVQVIRNRLSQDLPKNLRAAEECGTDFHASTAYMKHRGGFPMIEAVMESGRQARDIVDNMLSFSRKSDTRFSNHSLTELLDKTVALAAQDYDMKKKYDFRQIEVIREYDPSLPPIMCQGSQIQQVLLNLLTNGAQAMAERPPSDGRAPRLILRTLPEEQMARIEIEDNGPGMDETTRRRVFEPFFTTKNVGVGTGLGLSVSYFIVVETHRGTIAVESALGQGTKFIIRLPLEESE